MKSNKAMMPQIVGNTKLREHICLNILKNSLPHACIIEGAKGTGKHTIALMAAAALGCQQADNTNMPIPCGECDSCLKILERKSPDVIIVGSEGKASIGVDAVRFLKEDVHKSPNDLDYKIYIIEDADKMTVQAQNALLLTLEEPPAYVRFFLLCESANALLETIRSRAPIFRTEPISTDDIDKYICAVDKRAAQMKLSSPSDYKKLLVASGNGIGRALELLEPKTFSPMLENMKLAESFIELAVNKRPHREAFPVLSQFSAKRDQLKIQLTLLSDGIRDLIATKECETAPLRFYGDQDKAVELCDRTTLNTLFNLYNAVDTAIEENSRNANVRLMMIKLFSNADMI